MALLCALKIFPQNTFKTKKERCAVAHRTDRRVYILRATTCGGGFLVGDRSGEPSMPPLCVFTSKENAEKRRPEESQNHPDLVIIEFGWWDFVDAFVRLYGFKEVLVDAVGNGEQPEVISIFTFLTIDHPRDENGHLWRDDEQILSVPGVVCRSKAYDYIHTRGPFSLMIFHGFPPSGEKGFFWQINIITGGGGNFYAAGDNFFEGTDQESYNWVLQKGLEKLATLPESLEEYIQSLPKDDAPEVDNHIGDAGDRMESPDPEIEEKK